MISIEYVSRRPGLPLSEFHADARAGQACWAEGHAEDVLLLRIL